jgi:hypothetical protein
MSEKYLYEQEPDNIAIEEQRKVLAEYTKILQSIFRFGESYLDYQKALVSHNVELVKARKEMDIIGKKIEMNNNIILDKNEVRQFVYESYNNAFSLLKESLSDLKMKGESEECLHLQQRAIELINLLKIIIQKIP